jgi:hypothetical protein
MGREQRRAPRVNVDLAAWWEASSTQQEASITSLSVTGCFVLSGGAVEAKERIRLEITFPDATQIYPWAEVVEEASEIGFAVQFTSMEDEETQRLRQFVEQALATT